MSQEQRELLRVTNLLCSKIFGFCKKHPKETEEILAGKLSAMLIEIIHFMENNIKEQ